MHVTTVVVDPPDCLVTVKDIGLFEAAVVGTVKVVGGVVLVVVVAAITIKVDERGKCVRKLTFSSVCWPFLDDVGNASFVAGVLDSRVTVGVILTKDPAAVGLDLLTGDNPVAVVLVADILSD